MISSVSRSVIIIGGGIIGASCAAELSRRGSQVTLIEKDLVGHGCSYGNAGWMTPCFAMPLPMPGMMLKSLKWLMNPNGPLYIQPSPSILLFKWLTRFLFSMNEKQARRAIAGLVELSKISLSEYKKLSLRYPDIIDFQQKGLLMVAHSNSGMDAIIDEMNRVREYQIQGLQMNEEEIKSMEPALIGKLLGGVCFPNEAHGEPLGIVRALISEAKKNGATIIENCELKAFELRATQSISGILTSQGRFTGEAYVLATGSWSKDIARTLRLNVPILGGKGYAIIIPPLVHQPKYPIMITEKKLAITPRAHSLRLAGTLELVDQDFSITQRRVQNILNGAREFLKIPDEVQIQETWRGLRPCTPDGVPLIGWSSRISNLMLACGHQMLGLQSGAGTGIVVSDLIEGKPPLLDISIFNPSRFD